MLSGGVAFALLRRTSLYEKQVRNPLESPAHAGELVIDVLATLRVSDAYDRKPIALVPISQPLSSLLDQLAATRHATFPVADSQGKLVGVVSLATLRTMLDEKQHTGSLVVGDAMERLVTVAPSDSLSAALDRLLKSGYDEVVVSDGNGAVLGLIGHSEIVAAYNRELARRRQTAPA
jgi:CIC family chloride channel protein